MAPLKCFSPISSLPLQEEQPPRKADGSPSDCRPPHSDWQPGDLQSLSAAAADEDEDLPQGCSRGDHGSDFRPWERWVLGRKTAQNSTTPRNSPPGSAIQAFVLHSSSRAFQRQFPWDTKAKGSLFTLWVGTHLAGRPLHPHHCTTEKSCLEVLLMRSPLCVVLPVFLSCPECAKAFHAAGSKLVLCGRSGERLQELVRELDASGHPKNVSQGEGACG